MHVADCLGHPAFGHGQMLSSVDAAATAKFDPSINLSQLLYDYQVLRCHRGEPDEIQSLLGTTTNDEMI